MESRIKWLLFLFISLPLAAQTTVVTATITDPSGQLWANGSYTVTFYPVPNLPNNYQWQGAKFVPQVYKGLLDNSGAFSVTLPDSTTITPSGTQWQFVICPNATATCSTILTPVSGASQNLTSFFSSRVTPPTLFSATIPRAYSSSEVFVPPPNQGGQYYNVNSLQAYCWNGSSYIPCNPQGGGGSMPAVPNGSYQFNNNSQFGGNQAVLSASSFPGADWGAKVGACLAQLYSIGGGTCDATNMTGSQSIGSSLTIGNGSTSVKVVMGNMTLTRASGVQIFYTSNVTLVGQGKSATVIEGPSNATALLQVYGTGNPISNVKVSDFSIADTGSVTAGSIALQIGGSDPNIPAPQYNTTSTVVNETGFKFPGRFAHLAIYNKALTPTQILNHYNVGANTGSTYESTVIADGPISYWPFKETTGTTATDLISGRNGTYSGGFTLGSAPGIPGDSGTTSVLLDGTGSTAVYFPTYTWLFPGDFTYEGWIYRTVPNTFGFEDLLSFADSTNSNLAILQDNPSNGGISFNQTIGGTGAVFSLDATATPTGSWYYYDVVYHNGGFTYYVNGSLIPIGNDVENSTFSNMAVSGASVGTMLNSFKGCICYNKMFNIDSSGSDIGIETANNSGFAFGVNSDQWQGGRIGGPVGLFDFGTNKFTWKQLDFEGNASSTGKILYAQVSDFNLGSGYNVGDTFRPTGGGGNAVFTVTSVSSGAVTAFAITTPGTGYSNTLNSGTTTLTGSGSGLQIDVRVGGYMLLLSSGGDLIENPYEEAGSADYICGTGNQITGAWLSGNGGTYVPDYCSLATNANSGPQSSFIWGQGSTPQSIGLKDNSYISMGSNFMYDPYLGNGLAYVGPNPGAALGKNIWSNGPAWAGNPGQTYGFIGHSPWEVGVIIPHGGTQATGRATYQALANPAVPTLVATGGTGTTYSYWVVGLDNNGGVTLPTGATVSGPATLDATHYITITPPIEDGIICWNVLKTDTAHALTIDGTNICSNLSAAPFVKDTGQAVVSYSASARNTTGDLSVQGNSSFGGNASFGGGSSNIKTETASNTDLNGTLTLSGGTASFSFLNTYLTAPICTATDNTAVNAVQVTVTTTTLTITGTGTDVVSYICIGRT